MLQCDFCSATPIRWQYPARSFRRDVKLANVAVQAHSEGNWAACEECHVLIQAGERAKLAERSAQRFPIPRRQIPDAVWPQIIAEIRSIQDQFWAARKGAPAPIPIETS